jgi:hypothetical protein
LLQAVGFGFEVRDLIYSFNLLLESADLLVLLLQDHLKVLILGVRTSGTHCLTMMISSFSAPGSPLAVTLLLLDPLSAMLVVDGKCGSIGFEVRLVDVEEGSGCGVEQEVMLERGKGSWIEGGDQ